MTGDEIVNVLLMERAAGDARIVITVEGEEDCALLDLHVEWSVAKTQYAGSKSAVLAAAARSLADGLDWITFVIDADFDRYLGRDAAWPAAIIASERADLLTDAIMGSPAVLRGVLFNGGVAQARTLEAGVGTSLEKFCATVSVMAGAVREAIVMKELHITARGWDFSGVTLAALRGDDTMQTVIDEAVRRSRGLLDPAAVRLMITSRLQTTVDPNERYLNSHDILGVSTDVARRILGRNIGRDGIAAACRVAFRCEGFVILRVVREIRAWARSKHGVDPFRCALTA